MARADDTSNTNWIWLREALALAAAALGSVALAKQRLIEWLAAGNIPWRAMSWEALDATGIAKVEHERRTPGPVVIVTPTPSAVYHEGDPQFWGAGLTIDWEDNGARETFVAGGAQALGIEVSRAHLLALLPGVPSEDEKVGPQMRRVLRVLKKLYPPDGKVPDDVSTKAVQARVNEVLAADNRNLGFGAASWDTVNRARGRG